MYLAELDSQKPEGYQSEKDDNSVMRLRDLRKTRLTLAHINKDRKSTRLNSSH